MAEQMFPAARGGPMLAQGEGEEGRSSKDMYWL